MRGNVELAVAGILVALTTSAAAATYNCLPAEIIEKSDHFRVECAEPSGFEGGYPRDGADRIQFFAVSKADADLVKRFVYVVHTALTTGMVIQFHYTSGDVSGSAFGCESSDCRRPSAFALLAPATDVRIPYAVWPSGVAESVDQGKWMHYGPFSISQYRKLVVEMTGTGNADLYIWKDEPPTETNFTCRPQLGTSNESCTILGPDPKDRAATYYVGVKGVGTNNTYKLTVSIQGK